MNSLPRVPGAEIRGSAKGETVRRNVPFMAREQQRDNGSARATRDFEHLHAASACAFNLPYLLHVFCYINARWWKEKPPPRIQVCCIERETKKITTCCTGTKEMSRKPRNEAQVVGVLDGGLGGSLSRCLQSTLKREELEEEKHRGQDTEPSCVKANLGVGGGWWAWEGGIYVTQGGLSERVFSSEALPASHWRALLLQTLGRRN